MTQNRRKCYRIVLWCLLAAMLVFIFAMSAQSSVESDSTSGQVIIWLLRIFRSDYDSLARDAQTELVFAWQSTVRTLAHFSEYALLGLLARLLISQYDCKHTLLVPWLGAVLYAGTDEIHQIFVPGRICDVQDLCVDASGVLLGIGVATVVLRIVRKCREKRALAHT